MIRRTFLHTGAWSLLGLSLPGSIFPAFRHQSPAVNHWLRQLVAAVGARRRSGLWGQEERLQEQVRRTNAFLAVRGYASRDSGLYFSPGRPDICFYPLFLERAAAGLTDLLAPVLGRRPDGSWQQLVVLTGYQIEALARAAAALADRETPLAELLLPAGAVANAEGSFPTTLGSVAIRTSLHRGTATTQIVVRAGQDVIFMENFVSEHCLSSTPGVVTA